MTAPAWPHPAVTSGAPARAGSSAGAIRARFDDLVDGSSLRFPAVTRVLAAASVDEVVDVVREVERATAAGAWAFGFVGYEAAAAFAPELVTHAPAPGLPPAWFALAPEPVRVPVPAAPHAVATGRWRPRWSAAEHRAAVERVRAHIAAGDTYQVNLTSHLDSPGPVDPEALYAHLARAQRGAHHAYLDTGRLVVASASPELFFERADSRIRMRPMKGTAARGATPEQDAAAARALRQDPKERAENLMIVDLVRNDLGRVAEPGSVRVTSLFRVEGFATVHQLTSEVEADLRADVGLVEIFRALFPCGSVTGAPKARSMEIIRDLEPGPRGVYCGAVGVVAPPSSGHPTRFSVAIRTAQLDRATGRCSYGAGGGITWGSNAEREYRELLTKTRILPGAGKGGGRAP